MPLAMREQVLVQGGVQAAERPDLIPQAHPAQNVDDGLVRGRVLPGVRILPYSAVEQERLLGDEVEPATHELGVQCGYVNPADQYLPLVALK